METAYKLGIQCVTIYAFSIENFNRSPEEVDTLFGLLRDRLQYLSEHDDSYTRTNNVRVHIIGNKSLLPPDIRRDLDMVETKTNTPVANKMLFVCIPYTSRDEMARAMREVANKRMVGTVASKNDITLQMLEDNMYFGPGVPPLDLLIRTSGHTRISDFMLWQCNYQCTVEFVDTLWPEFRFIGLMMVILKWSYYRTLQLENQLVVGAKDAEDMQRELVDILRELPPPPPFASVSKR